MEQAEAVISVPAVGFILASLWNDYVLKEKHVGLQDTNDTFLLRICKKMALTPWFQGWLEVKLLDKLILGEVAKKYNLHQSYWRPEN